MTERDGAHALPGDVTTRLVLVRHGQALDVDGRCIGHTDVPLAPEGAAAIRRLVAHRTVLPSIRGGGTVTVFSSDLARARESARLVAEAIGVGVTTDARLREMNFGEWDGRRWSDVEAAAGVRLHSWMERWTEASTPQGETLGDVARRAAAWLAEHIMAPAGERRTVVVAHAGWIRAAVSQLTGHSLAKIFDIPIDHAHATIIDVGASGNHLIASNVDHFGDLSRSFQGDPELSVLPQPL